MHRLGSTSAPWLVVGVLVLVYPPAQSIKTYSDLSLAITEAGKSLQSWQ